MSDDPKPAEEKPPLVNPITVPDSAFAWINPANWGPLAQSLGPMGFLTVFFSLLFTATILYYASKHDETMKGQAWLRHDIGRFQVAFDDVADIHQAFSEAIAAGLTETDAARRKVAADKLVEKVENRTRHISRTLRAGRDE